MWLLYNHVDLNSGEIKLCVAADTLDWKTQTPLSHTSPLIECVHSWLLKRDLVYSQKVNHNNNIIIISRQSKVIQEDVLRSSRLDPFASVLLCQPKNEMEKLLTSQGPSQMYVFMYVFRSVKLKEMRCISPLGQLKLQSVRTQMGKHQADQCVVDEARRGPVI